MDIEKSAEEQSDEQWVKEHVPGAKAYQAKRRIASVMRMCWVIRDPADVDSELGLGIDRDFAWTNARRRLTSFASAKSEEKGEEKVTDEQCDAHLAPIFASMGLSQSTLEELDYPKASHRATARHAIAELAAAHERIRILESALRVTLDICEDGDTGAPFERVVAAMNVAAAALRTYADAKGDTE